MKTKLFAIVAFSSLLIFPDLAQAQQLQLANPNWNITLTDFGYADLLFDNTPGFEGREYLCGEWGAAVTYQAGGTTVGPQWLEPNFIYPDWTSNSAFQVVSPLTQIGLNPDNLPIAQSIIANGDLQITLRFEMLDTIVGTPMGMTPSSNPASGTYMNSNRYVLKQTYTVKNVSSGNLANVQLFQLLHGLNSEHGVYDNRAYAGPFSNFQYDATLGGVDAFAFGAPNGLEDFIAFHSAIAPTALEIGHYGIEGNGVDNHGLGKPSDGVHLSIEDNWQTTPFNSRQGTDSFQPSHRWIAGAQRWMLGNLLPGQSTSFDVILSILTGTKVSTGTGSSGDCDGGSSVPGGVHYEFEDVSSEGSMFSEFSRADAAEIEVHIAQGEFGSLTFPLPGMPVQLWELEFTGSYSGAIILTFGYDASLLPAGFDETGLAIYHFTGGAWMKLPGTVGPVLNTITVTTATVGVFALGADTNVSFLITANVQPAGSGSATGAGTYPQGAMVSLVATADPGFAFSSWTENGSLVSLSPTLNFAAQADRIFTANFVAAGAGQVISTASLPLNGGATVGDGVYTSGQSATVSAAPAAGYKFSKWLENGATVSSSANYSFIVATDRSLVAKFKPICTLTTIAEPPQGGEIDADNTFDPGDLAILIANPNQGYSFVNWTENGVVVSDEPQFQFNITGNRTLVGNFALGHRIDVSADPKTAGVVSGGGVYAGEATVFAEPRPGYVFLAWTEGGITVSTEATYSFIPSADRVLVATFAALPSVTVTTLSVGTVTVSWPAGATDWILQETGDLIFGPWENSMRAVTVVDNQNQVELSMSEGPRYFRLAHP